MGVEGGPSGVEAFLMTTDPGGIQALLAKLRALQDRPPEPTSQRPMHARPWAAPARTLHALPFNEAVEHIEGLLRDPTFVQALRELQAQQDALEAELDRERRALIGTHGEHLRGSSGARTQASYAHWTWDALKRWDAHRHAQQRRLEEMRVPCFYDTNDPDALRQQQRLLPLLLSAYHHV